MDIIGEMAHLTVEEQVLFRRTRVQPVSNLALACGGVIDRVLREYSKAQEAAWDDEYSTPGADAALRRADRFLKIAGDVAAPILVHVIEADLGMPHEPAILPPGHPESL